jgi:hypothetical protein
MPTKDGLRWSDLYPVPRPCGCERLTYAQALGPYTQGIGPYVDKIVPCKHELDELEAAKQKKQEEESMRKKRLRHGQYVKVVGKIDGIPVGAIVQLTTGGHLTIAGTDGEVEIEVEDDNDVRLINRDDIDPLYDQIENEAEGLTDDDADNEDEDASEDDEEDEEKFLRNGRTDTQIAAKIAELAAERDELTRILQWMKESETKRFNGMEFRVYEAITALQKEPNKAAAAKTIAKLLGRDIKKAKRGTKKASWE